MLVTGCLCKYQVSERDDDNLFNSAPYLEKTLSGSTGVTADKTCFGFFCLVFLKFQIKSYSKHLVHVVVQLRFNITLDATGMTRCWFTLMGTFNKSHPNFFHLSNISLLFVTADMLRSKRFYLPHLFCICPFVLSMYFKVNEGLFHTAGFKLNIEILLCLVPYKSFFLFLYFCIFEQ